MSNLRLVLRVAARYQRAKEFTSPEAFKEYLHEHPQADKSKHTVVKDHGEDEGGGGHKEEPKKSWKERLKGLSDKAKAFVKEAPKAVKQFVEDESFRRKTLQDAHKALVDAPEKLVKSALKTVKDEVKEFKEAGQGIAAVVKGGKMTPHQKKALKTVATHMAISIAAAALTSTGPLAVAGAVGKGLAKHVAMKAVSGALGHLHILEEVGHIGHGVSHLLKHIATDNTGPEAVLLRYAKDAKDGKDIDPEELLGNFITAAVAKEIGRVSDEDVEAALEGKEPGDSKKAYSYAR